jgi:anti-sigma factor RsiW
MITCRELIGLVTDYFEGSMSPEERLQFERHIMICPPCRGYLAQMEKTLRMAGGLTEESIDPEAEAALLEAFRDWRQERGTQ